MPTTIKNVRIPKRLIPRDQDILFQDDFPPGMIGIEFDIDITSDTNTATVWTLKIEALENNEWRFLGGATRRGGINYERDGVTIVTTAHVKSFWGVPFPAGTIGQVSLRVEGGSVRLGAEIRIIGD